MSLQLPAILSPPTPCIPSPALTVSPLEEVAEVALPFTGRRPILGFAHPTQARQCIRPYRVQHCFIYGLAVHLRLPPTPPFDDAVSFDYGQPVFCPMGTSTPLLVRTLRRTQGPASGGKDAVYVGFALEQAWRGAIQARARITKLPTENSEEPFLTHFANADSGSA